MTDLRVDAIITASFVYNAAMRNEKLPRKPEMKFPDSGQRGPGGPGGPPPGM
jgi:hypothetical protein